MAQSAQVAKVNWWHERFADWLIANPSLQLKDAAKEFGVTLPWLSTVKNSDAFIDYFRERSRAHSNAIIDLKAKALGVADMALDHLGERVANEGALMTTGQLLEIVDTTMKRTAESSPQSATQVNVNVVAADTLAEARAAMRAPKSGAVIELKPSGEGHGAPPSKPERT